MHDDIHPIAPPAGTVPAGLAPYRPPRRRLRKVAAVAAATIALGAGAVTVAQVPLHNSHQATVFTATQNPDDDTTVPAPQPPPRTQTDPGEGGQDD
ncbi:MAG TPA: hypothetical protein VHO29_03730 [Marmoricola sp.]|nr:hypothetical protein [Marmoricola sp.]